MHTDGMLFQPQYVFLVSASCMVCCSFVNRKHTCVMIFGMMAFAALLADLISASSDSDYVLVDFSNAHYYMQ